MTTRMKSLVAVVGGGCAVALLVVPTSGQGPTTSWGAPDLRGTWDFRSITPFERPASFSDVMDEREDGSTQEWMLEAGTPNTLLRRGLTRTILTVGTEVQVRGYQSKDKICDPLCRGSGRDITFPDGTSLFMGSSGTGAPRDGADAAEPAR